MPPRKSDQKPTWQKTAIQGLLRHPKSGGYYARLHIAGKEKWISLKSKVFEVAKAKMRTDETVEDIRHAQETKQQLHSGKVTVAALIEIHQTDLKLNTEIKGGHKGVLADSPKFPSSILA